MKILNLLTFAYLNRGCVQASKEQVSLISSLNRPVYWVSLKMVRRFDIVNEVQRIKYEKPSQILRYSSTYIFFQFVDFNLLNSLLG